MKNRIHRKVYINEHVHQKPFIGERHSMEGPFGLVRLPQANTDYSFLV